ncbi:MAG: hypothetical protein C4541_09190 [Candidatus Auribacter fodinae]|jgi:hypothetical protein|uniref:Uncharacterized protein n=1 Tax=Candidatus Auribacter fodinae TaxID=2093366 RepID=A0A3A4QVW0_9BACT|nr:MAG: hypothetical protein C4541_09190 [Candidatus Auribacter fodinae]
MNIPSSPGTKHENIYPRSVPDNDNGELIIDKDSIDRLLNMDSSSIRRLSPAKIQRLVHRLDSLRPLAQDGIISLQGAVLKVSSPEYPSIARSVQGINRTLRTIGLPNAAHLLRALFAGPEQDGDV